PGAMGTVNLNAGGTLTTRQVYMADPSAYSTFNFDGGTLVAAPGAASEFMSGLSYVTVLPGGAIIDSGDNAINIAQDLNSGGGGLTKLGSGSMRLSGNNTYSGATVVSGGKLTVTSTSIGGGSYSVADNAGLGVAVTSVGMSMPASTLTLGNSASLGIDLGSFGNPQVAPLSVSGVLSRSGTVTVNIEPSSTLSVGQFPLVQYGSLGGAGNFVLGTLPPGVVAELVMNAGNNSIDLNVTTVFLPRWEGLAGGTWDIAVTQNWIDQITMGPQYFYQGTRATFDDNAQGTTTVNIVTDVTPGGVIVDNSLKDYTFNGIGRITGNAGLTKLGTGTLTVSTTNNPYTGETMIDGGGTVVSTVANNLGNNSALVIRDGTLGLGAASQKFGSVTVSNGVIAGTTAAVTSPTFKLGGGTVSASLAGGALTTIGTNTDLVTLLGANTYTGRTVLGGATVSVTNIANGGVVSGIGAATAHPTNLVFNNGALNYDGPSAVTDRGYVVDGGGRLGVLNRLTILGEVVPAAGSFAKSGPGTLVYARPGTNVLSPGGYNVSSGTLVMDGGASTPENYLQTNRVGEMWVGYDGENAAALVLTNTSLGISGWLAMDRGNGTANHSSSVNLYDSYMTVGNFSMGYANNLAGFAASPFLRLFGNSSLTSSGRAFIGENVGGDATLILGGTSKLTLLNEWFALGNSGKGTMVLSNFAQVTLPGDLNLGDIENGNGTLYMYDNVTNLCATLYVGKGANSVGVAYQYGGYMGRSVGGGDWRLANNATATGTYNLFGGIFQPIQQLQVGASGTGTWNQSGGETLLGGYPSAGRFQGSVGTINVSGGVFTQTGEGNLLIIGEEGSGTLNISGSGVVNSLGGLSIAHTATGSGLVNLDGGILSVRSLRSPAGTGILNLNGGVLRANRDEANFVSTTLLMNVMGGGAYLDSGAYNIAIAQPFLDGGSGSGLTKLGAGTVSLGGANTYTGPTAVNEGTLRINGSITAGQVTVQSGGAIGGAGTIPGNVVVNARGAVSPGANTATIGTLNIGGNLTLSGNLVVDVAKTGTPTSDLTVVGGTLVNNGTGTISVSNLGDSLANGDTFQLFNKPVVNGQTLTFASSPGLGLTWTNQLAVNGTIAVIKGTVPVSTNIVGTIVGNNLELSWPSDYVGWRLLGQTNALTTGLSDNWVTVPGSTTTNRVVLPLDKNNGSSFFRLVYP
ncbi:MAG TPA: autotransporter-associated beta strand repeat-containing protein, partial [Clostridia bacterium]|nr:autotransporter-associated beta strand repeat-containing protein [Clostridia bacterium]